MTLPREIGSDTTPEKCACEPGESPRLCTTCQARIDREIASELNLVSVREVGS